MTGGALAALIALVAGEPLSVELNELLVLLLVLLLFALLVSLLFCLPLRPPDLLFVDLGVEAGEVLLLLLMVGLSLVGLLFALTLLRLLLVLLLRSFVEGVVGLAVIVFVILFVLILTFKLSVTGAAAPVARSSRESLAGDSPGELCGEMSVRDLDRDSLLVGVCSFESCGCSSAGVVLSPLTPRLLALALVMVLRLFVVASTSLPAGEVGALELVVLFIWHQCCVSLRYDGSPLGCSFALVAVGAGSSRIIKTLLSLRARKIWFQYFRVNISCAQLFESSKW